MARAFQPETDEKLGRHLDAVNGYLKWDAESGMSQANIAACLEAFERGGIRASGKNASPWLSNNRRKPKVNLVTIFDCSRKLGRPAVSLLARNEPIENDCGPPSLICRPTLSSTTSAPSRDFRLFFGTLACRSERNLLTRRHPLGHETLHHSWNQLVELDGDAVKPRHHHLALPF